MQQPAEHPSLITVLGILAIIWGALSLCGGGLLLLGDSILARRIALRIGVPPRGLATLLLVVSLTLLVQAILYVIFGIGALQLSSWAWTLGIVLAIVGLGVRVATLFFDHRLSTIVGDMMGIVIDASVLVYLLQPRVRHAFHQA